ncbi:MAG TPA: hypothetical protein VFN57_14650 [Thermomicrobiaceae bacterium]|nr:hypothetical protein [Thermomicrobiaceae bacterium]
MHRLIRRGIGTWLILTAAAALLLAACGGSSTSTTPTTSAGTTSSTATSSPVVGAASPVASPNASPSASPSASLVASPSASPTANVTVQVGNSPTLGPILVDSQGMTLYEFSADTSTTSNCTGACAKIWPPLTPFGPSATPTTASPVSSIGNAATPVAGPGATGTLSTITRPDGTYQVTYNGHPLYTYIKDTKPGDTTGNGVAGKWSVAKP